MGSIPFAFFYGKIFKKIDIRKHGSGNIGATNVLRVFGTKAGVIVLLLDVLKGFIPVFMVQMLLSSFRISVGDEFIRPAISPSEMGATIQAALPVLVGVFAILGHSFTIFLSFKGGKGVATSAGVFLALCPLTSLGALLFFALLVMITKYVSFGSIWAMVFIVIANLFWEENPYVKAFTIVVAIFIILKHIPNIKRLFNGTENKISFKKKVNDRENTGHAV